MIKLRPYQVQYVEEILLAFKNIGKRVILAAPTGAGKTAIFSEIVRRASQKNKSVLVLTDRTELFFQTFSAIERVNITPQFINPNTKTFDPNILINVAMVETLARRTHLPINPDLIICDEAHKANFNKIIDRFPDAYVIGATATPIGKHIYKYYSHIVQCADIPELIELGYLAPCKAYQMQDDFSDLEMRAGEFTESSLFNHFNKRKLYDGLIQKWSEVAFTLKTIVFCVNIEHTINTYNAFIEEGITAVYVTSLSTPEQRKKAIDDFKNDEVQVIVNCGILTTGYDESSIQCVVMNRKTASLPLWLQCCGRGSRIHPDKSHFVVLDFGQNHSYHGLWDEPRKWKLKPSSKKKLGAAPIKECPQCFAMLPASATTCKFCYYVFPLKEDSLHKGELVAVHSKTKHLIGLKISQLSVQDLYTLQLEKRFKAPYIWRIVRSKGENAISQYAKLAGYSKGWIFRQIQEIHDCNFHDITINI